jgi:DNA polymerase-3 subunit alpha
MALAVVPPNINRSGYAFTVRDEKTVIYGLGAIKGVGQAAIDGMIQERLSQGAFQDLFDLCRRVDSRKVTRRVLEALIRAGALDSFGENRATLMEALPQAVKQAEQHQRDSVAGQNDLFGGGAEPMPVTVEIQRLPEWDDDQRLSGERETLGLYLTGHPIDRYLAELKEITGGSIASLTESSGQTATPGSGQGGYGRSKDRSVVMAGLVVDLRTRVTQSGARMAFLTLDDRSARMEVRVFTKVFEQYRALLAKDRVLVVQGGLGLDDYSGELRMTVEHVFDIDQARERFAKRLVLNLEASRAGNGFMRHLEEILSPFREGACPVLIDYRNAKASVQIPLGADWRVHPTDELLHRLRELGGEQQVRVEYQ